MNLLPHHQGAQLIALYQRPRISRDRVLIKIASTWEASQAAEQLELEGFHCKSLNISPLPSPLLSSFTGRGLR